MKKIFIIIAFAFSGIIFSANASAQVVVIKPKTPKSNVKKSLKPKTMGTWVWVPGHWEWKKKSKVYKWVKPMWKKAPKKKKYWKKGHWKKVKGGWKWFPGHWI